MGRSADVPPLRPRPTLGMADMGMAGMAGMGGMDHGAMAGMDHSGMDHGGMSMRDPANAPPDMKVGVGVDMIAPLPQDRTGPPGLGLEDVGHRALTYRDLVALAPHRHRRPPSRPQHLHPPGTMAPPL